MSENLSPLSEFSVFVNGAGWITERDTANRHNALWSAKHLACVVALFYRYDLWTIASLLGRTPDAVRKQANDMGLKFASLKDRRPKPDTRRGVA